jgi:hypothetical protein
VLVDKRRGKKRCPLLYKRRGVFMLVSGGEVTKEGEVEKRMEARSRKVKEKGRLS